MTSTISKEAIHQIKTLTVNGLPIADKAVVHKNGVSTFWIKANNDFPDFVTEKYAEWLAGAIEKHVPGVAARVAGVEWDGSEQTHIVKLRLGVAESVSEQAVSPPPASVPVNIPELPDAEDEEKLFGQIVRAVGGDYDADFRGTIRTSITDLTEIDGLATRYYKAVKLFAKRVTCTYRALSNGRYSIYVSASGINPPPAINP